MANETYPETVIPGTTIPIPEGSGVQTLQPISPPFRTNAPAWYTPPGSVWSKMGCAIPQPGRYLQTNNGPIFDFVNVVGRQMFNVLWKYDDRKFDRFPSRDCLFEIYQLLVIGRKRLTDMTVLSNQSPLQPTHAKPAPQMFLVYPVPFFGPLGCINQWLHRATEMTMMMLSEAMQHSDNELSFHFTKSFFDSTYGYLKYLLVGMATKFFGVDAATASADNYTIADPLWATYNPAAFSVSVEATASRPPIGWTPTDLDLEPIRGLPVEKVIPFLQPWPDSALKYASGGIWANPSPPASGTSGGTGGNPQLFATGGPPSA